MNHASSALRVSTSPSPSSAVSTSQPRLRGTGLKRDHRTLGTPRRAKNTHTPHTRTNLRKSTRACYTASTTRQTTATAPSTDMEHMAGAPHETNALFSRRIFACADRQQQSRTTSASQSERRRRMTYTRLVALAIITFLRGFGVKSKVKTRESIYMSLKHNTCVQNVCVYLRLGVCRHLGAVLSLASGTRDKTHASCLLCRRRTCRPVRVCTLWIIVFDFERQTIRVRLSRARPVAATPIRLDA